MTTPLSRLAAPSPLSLRATRFGKGDNAGARCKPEHVVRWIGVRCGLHAAFLWQMAGVSAGGAQTSATAVVSLFDSCLRTFGLRYSTI